MKNLIILLIILLPIVGSSQKLIELSINNEDKAIGLNFIDAGNHFLVGAENGTFKYDRAKVEHQKYKAGYSIIFCTNTIGESGMIAAITPCYNRYNVIYNYDRMKHMPKFSLELSFRLEFTNRVSGGAQIDVIHKTGGFNLGILIHK